MMALVAWIRDFLREFYPNHSAKSPDSMKFRALNRSQLFKTVVRGRLDIERNWAQ